MNPKKNEEVWRRYGVMWYFGSGEIDGICYRFFCFCLPFAISFWGLFVEGNWRGSGDGSKQAGFCRLMGSVHGSDQSKEGDS